jgi:hypothetical protein
VPEPTASRDPAGRPGTESRSTAGWSEVPAPLRWAALVARIEAVGLLIAAIILLVLIVVHTSTRLWAAFAVAGFAVLGASVLWLCARGLLHLRPSSRTPVLMIQLLALPVTYSLGIQAGWYWIGVPIMALAVATIVLLLVRPSRVALDRSY